MRGGLLVLLVASFVLYYPLNHATADLHNLRTPIDEALPLVPVFSVPYLLHLPVLVGSLLYFLFAYPDIFRRIAPAFVLANVAAALVFAFAQTVVLRPVISGTDFFSDLVRFVYASDNPYNDWPSLHTAHAALYTSGWFMVNRRAGLIALSFAVTVMAATVLIKQHYIADVVGGLLFAAGSLSLSDLLVRFAPPRGPGQRGLRPASRVGTGQRGQRKW